MVAIVAYGRDEEEEEDDEGVIEEYDRETGGEYRGSRWDTGGSFLRGGEGGGGL